MRNQHFPHNKILPVKSLVENNRQKKQYLFLANKQIKAASQSFHTPRSNHSLNNHPPLSARPGSPMEKQYEEKNHRLSMGSREGNQIRYLNNVQSNEKNYTPLEQFYYSSRTERYPKVEQNIQTKAFNITADPKVETRADMTPKKTRFGDSEERSNVRIALIDKRQSFKSMTLRRDSGDLEKDSSFASGKMDDETWNASRMDKAMNSEKEPPIFKNQLTKLKTELYQKEANLFELSQKLEEKDTTIRDLSVRLNLANQLSHNLSKEGHNHNSKLSAEVERLTEQVAKLSNELNSRREQFQKSEENSSTSKKLLMLKIKQYELDEHEKTQYIIELKEREKKNALNCQKLINGQKELLRQKQSQLVKVSQAAQFYKEAVSKNIEQIEDLNRQLELKQEVIRQLSGQVTDLKCSLNELQQRMREMIDNEDDLKRQILNNQSVQNLNQAIKKLRVQIEEKNVQIGTLRRQNGTLNNQLYEFKEQVREENSVKQFELSMMQKTCDDYRKKIQEYQKYSGQMGIEILSKNSQPELRKMLIDDPDFDRNVSKEYSTKSKSSPRKSISPMKQSTLQKEVKKLKHLNLRLFRDNDKMSSRIRDLTTKVSQLGKVNNGLNEVIVLKDVQKLDRQMSSRLKQYI